MYSLPFFENECFTKYQIKLYNKLILYLPLVLLLLVVNVVWITLGHDKKEGVVSSIIIDLLIVIGPAMNIIKNLLDIMLHASFLNSISVYNTYWLEKASM